MFKLISTILTIVTLLSLFYTNVHASFHDWEDQEITRHPKYSEFIDAIVSNADRMGIPNPERLRQYIRVSSGQITPEDAGYTVKWSVMECFPGIHEIRIRPIDPQESWSLSIDASFNEGMFKSGRNPGFLSATLKTPKETQNINY